MAMSKDKLAGILSGKAPKAEPIEDEEMESEDLGSEDDGDLKVDLAADVGEAIKSGDDAALADALEAFLDHCYASREE